MNEEDVMKQLKKEARFFEIYHKTSFLGYRKNAKGEDQEVAVDILDMGSGTGDSRYSCIATTKDGKMATGNPASSIDVAISIVHWYDLDK
jgi:hypothetical protein